MRNTCHILFESDDGIKLCRAGKLDVNMVCKVGHELVKNQLSYHGYVKNATHALHQSSNIPPPSIEERMFQVAIRGNIASMMIGKFLPCHCLQSDPNIQIQCACGFKLKDGKVSRQLIEILKPQCNKTKRKRE